jgi:imidazolonepropionase-like amidohydrolase
MTLAVKGGRFYTITGGIIEDGVMLVDDGKITAIGSGLAISPGAEVLDVAGKCVTPGLMDCHAHVGMAPEQVDWEYGDANETTDAVTGHVRAIDGLDWDDKAFDDAVSGGVTTLLIHPGSSNVIGGADLVVKSAGRPETRVLRNPAGMKMAWTAAGKFGRWKGSKHQYPTTRMGIAGILRAQLLAARQFLEKKEKALAEGKEPPEVDARDELMFDVLVRVLKREIPARIHSMTPVDILAILRIKEEFGIDCSIDHGDEAHMIADRLKDAGVPVIFGPWLGDREQKRYPYSNPRVPQYLAKAGVLTALMTDHPVVSIRDLRVQAGIVCRYGLDEVTALEMITINAARIMGLDSRLGSLEPGKDADFAVFSGHPLESLSRVEAVFIDGANVLGGR